MFDLPIYVCVPCFPCRFVFFPFFFFFFFFFFFLSCLSLFFVLFLPSPRSGSRSLVVECFAFVAHLLTFCRRGSMQRLQAVKAQPNRVQSKGVIVMSDRWKTQKATNALIQTDLANYPHHPIQRKFATSEGYEAGFICVGMNTITFLAPDNTTVISR